MVFFGLGTCLICWAVMLILLCAYWTCSWTQEATHRPSRKRRSATSHRVYPLTKSATQKERARKNNELRSDSVLPSLPIILSTVFTCTTMQPYLPADGCTCGHKVNIQWKKKHVTARTRVEAGWKRRGKRPKGERTERDADDAETRRREKPNSIRFRLLRTSASSKNAA